MDGFSNSAEHSTRQSVAERPVFALRLRAEPHPTIPPAIRLRRLLKYALRACHLRCIEAKEEHE